MKIKKLKGRLVLQPTTTNDCFNCGLIAAQQKVKVEVADYGLKSITIEDQVVVDALCEDMAALPMSDI